MPPAVITKQIARARIAKSFAQDLGVRAALDIVAGVSLRREIFPVRPRQLSRPVYCRRHTPDIYTLLQVIGRGESLFDAPCRPSVIVDLGANVGFSTLAYATAFPGARIIAVEPDAANCRMFRLNTAGEPNVELVEAAIWHRSGHIAIINPTAPSDEYQVAEVESGAAGSMPAVSIVDLMSMKGLSRIDVLKMDIEGSERELLDDAGWLDHVGQLLVELHDRFKPGCRHALDRALAGRPHVVQMRGEYVAATFT